MKIICVEMVKLLSVGEGGVRALLSKSIVSVSLLKSILLQELFRLYQICAILLLSNETRIVSF